MSDGIVVDASVALAWCYPHETSDFADHVLTRLERQTVVVPALWTVEIANAILAGERRGRLTEAKVSRFFALLDRLIIEVDPYTSRRAFSATLPLSRSHQLSVYDACYLELAIRRGLELATLDAQLRLAAERAGVSLC